MHTPSSASGEALNDDAHYINSYNKKLKVAKNKAVALSRNNDDLTTPISAQSSQVWKYAIRCQNSNFSICCLCPNDNKISINNGWTSTLRRPLITKHQLHELTLLSYEPPSRFSVTRHLKHLYKFHVKKLVDDLALIDDISITLDLWRNKQMRSFLVITDNLNNRLNDSEQKVTNIEQIDNNDDIIEPGEHDEIIINIAGDESSEIFDSNDEEQLLFDNSDEECVDNWTTDVIQSDYDTVRKQNMILFVLKKCRGLTSMIKRSTIITLYFDAERKKY
ncbi:unnamed protein product [Rotaria sp. Silwood1]|nr:unnamed protein product [Rotaria sp. Silwood1]CAF3795655.1 unnamed protein product [Rotaria sp. Silwood1]CAF4838107.1 unnamed protein product [Rotaria sp. Silwood1]